MYLGDNGTYIAPQNSPQRRPNIRKHSKVTAQHSKHQYTLEHGNTRSHTHKRPPTNGHRKYAQQTLESMQCKTHSTHNKARNK